MKGFWKANDKDTGKRLRDRQENTDNQPRKKQTRATVWVSDKTEIRSKNIKQAKHFITLKDTICNKDETIMNTRNSNFHKA